MSSASLVGHTVWLGETYTGGDLTSVVAECARVSNPTGKTIKVLNQTQALVSSGDGKCGIRYQYY